MSGFLITPSIQHYHWGKRGKLSRVASLIDSVDPVKAYAEAWYGDHQKSPSNVRGSDILSRQTEQTLRQKIATNPREFLGQMVIETFGASLPFLFKILSVEAPLSIQVHPSKEQALTLHKADPRNFPDTNHKPELVVALSEFEVLCGFKDSEQLQQVFALFPELGLLLGQELSQQFLRSFSEGQISSLSQAIERFYATDPSTLQRVVALTVDRLERSPNLDPSQKLFLRLVARGFESDPGVFVALFLQHRTLQPGESMFTPARVLHAYLNGDAIECMANSDNVVRAGLTPKHQDVEALIKVVDWTAEARPIFFSAPQALNGMQEIAPPTSEFVLHVYRNCGLSLGRLGALGSPEMLVLLDGSAQTSYGEKMEIGDAFFIPADCTGDSIMCEGAFVVRVSVPRVNSQSGIGAYQGLS